MALLRILSILTLLIGVQSANILFLSGSLSAGHHIWNRVLASHLAQRGHNVTFLSPERDVSEGHLHFIHMEKVYERVAEKQSHARQNHLQDRQAVFRRIKESHRLNNAVSSEQSRTAGVQQLLNYPPTFRFDAIIHDTSSAQSLLGFWLHFRRPPLISVSPSYIPFHLFSVADIPYHPGCMQHPSSEFTTEPVLATRVYNILYFLYDRIFRAFPFMRTENAIARRVFGEEVMSSMDVQSIERNTQLFLVNTNPVMDSSLLLPASVIPVGGLQLNRPGRIRNDIKQFLDASQNGVIVFSLGADALLTPPLRREEDEVFLEVFQHLHQYDFLWKYDKREKLECPRNILMTDWLDSQHMILQHPKVRLFITNGGPLSVQEAIFAGVPIIGIPMRFDQRHSLARLRSHGAAQLLPLQRLRNDTLLSLIMASVESPSLKANAMRMAQLLHTQPDSAAISPVQRAVEWIEYTVVHADLVHLKSPLANVPFLIVYSLDIILAVVVIVMGFGAIAFKHIVFDKMFARAANKQKEQQQQQKEQPTIDGGIVAVGGEVEGMEIMGPIAEEVEGEEVEVAEDKKSL